MKTIPCFICDKCLELDLEFEKDEDSLNLHPVYGGLWFRATGNFGSTIFDPILKEEELRIVICDKCV